MLAFGVCVCGLSVGMRSRVLQEQEEPDACWIGMLLGLDFDGASAWRMLVCEQVGLPETRMIPVHPRFGRRQ
jgi:hypothetical protein